MSPHVALSYFFSLGSETTLDSFLQSYTYILKGSIRILRTNLGKPSWFEFPSLWGLSSSKIIFQSQWIGQTYSYIWVLRSILEFHTYFLYQYAPHKAKSTAKFCRSAEENEDKETMVGIQQSAVQNIGNHQQTAERCMCVCQWVCWRCSFTDAKERPYK